jgi:hypothetical protein
METLPLTMLQQVLIRTRILTRYKNQCLLFNAIIKDLVLLCAHWKDPIEREPILLRPRPE